MVSDYLSSLSQVTTLWPLFSRGRVGPSAKWVQHGLLLITSYAGNSSPVRAIFNLNGSFSLPAYLSGGGEQIRCSITKHLSGYNSLLDKSWRENTRFDFVRSLSLFADIDVRLVNALRIQRRTGSKAMLIFGTATQRIFCLTSSRGESQRRCLSLVAIKVKQLCRRRLKAIQRPRWASLRVVISSLRFCIFCALSCAAGDTCWHHIGTACYWTYERWGNKRLKGHEARGVSESVAKYNTLFFFWELEDVLVGTLHPAAEVSMA